jgi:hypothetical protein
VTSAPSGPLLQQSTARLAELIAALSLATGLGMGQPMDLPLRIAGLAVKLGRALGLASADLSDIYYLALVAHIGCTSDSVEFASFTGGDDIALRRRMMTWPSAEPPELLREMLGYVGRGRPPLQRARLATSVKSMRSITPLTPGRSAWPLSRNRWR